MCTIITANVIPVATDNTAVNTITSKFVPFVCNITNCTTHIDIVIIWANTNTIKTIAERNTVFLFKLTICACEEWQHLCPIYAHKIGYPINKTINVYVFANNKLSSRCANISAAAAHATKNVPPVNGKRTKRKASSGSIEKKKKTPENSGKFCKKAYQ